MSKLIYFCNKTSGSIWWLIATIASIVIPALAIMYTFYQFIGIHSELMEKLIMGCDYSFIKFVWIDNNLQCAISLLESAVTRNSLIVLDIFLIYTMTFADTFFRLWKCCVFTIKPLRTCSKSFYQQ
jgi:hypothetical protein